MVRSESAMTDKDGPFLKSIAALRLVGEGVEPLVEEGSRKYTNEIINQARQDAGLCGIDICGHCTTHNAVPCNSGYRFCIYDKDRNCRIHDKSDPLKASKICPKGICNEIVRIIKSRHRYHLPNFKNTDARKWFQNPFEIMKCFIPTEGYQDKETVEDTDCAGLLSVISNCKSFQSLVAEDLSSQDNIFVKMREARNKILHSAGFKITDRDLQEYMKLMLSILNDDMFLAHDKDAQAAAEKIQEIADSSVHVYCGEEVQDPDLNPKSDDSLEKTFRGQRIPDRYFGSRSHINLTVAEGFLGSLRKREVWSSNPSKALGHFENRADRAARQYLKVFIERDSGNSQKVLEPVFKNKPNKQSGSDMLENHNGVSAVTPNKPKQSIVIVFAVQNKQAGTSIVSRELNRKLTNGETNGETQKQGVGGEASSVPHQAVMGTTHTT